MLWPGKCSSYQSIGVRQASNHTLIKMTKRDSAQPDAKRRRKGARSIDAHNHTASETSLSTTTKSVDAKKHASTKKSQLYTGTNNDSAKPLSLSEVSALENIHSQNIDSIDDVSCYRKTCQEIELLVTEVEHLKAAKGPSDKNAISERRIKTALLTLSLKKLNRLALIRSKTAKGDTQEMKHKVDGLHLDLQNLLYEVVHMKKEIKKCTDFTSKVEEIDLIEVDTFYEEASPDISKPEITKYNKHSQMLARLEWELCQRKKLAALKNQLLKDKVSMEKEISRQTEILSSLQPSISGILKSTIPLQEKLDLKIDERKAQFEAAPFLPWPLYILYVHANAYCEGQDSDVSVSIDGDEQAAKALHETDAQISDKYDLSEPEDGNESGDKEEYKERTRNENKEQARIEEQKRSIFRKHPLQIHIKIVCKEFTVLQLVFGYLTSLKIVTVSSSLIFPDNGPSYLQNTSSMLSPHHFLKHLFGEDDAGEDSPNLSNQIKLEKLGLEKFSTYTTVLGRPYYWAQRLSGLNYLSKNQKQTLSTDENHQYQNFAYTINAIKCRVGSRMALQKQLAELESLRVPFSKSIVTLFPACIQTKLVDWRSITYSDFLVFCSSQGSSFSLTQEDLFYLIRLQKGKDGLVAAVCIGVDYPWQPPLFIIKQTQSANLSDFAKDIEREMNINSMELMDVGNCNEIISHQLQKLMACFDVYCETANANLKNERLYLRKQRGRDRSRPYKYIGEKGLFVH